MRLQENTGSVEIGKFLFRISPVVISLLSCFALSCDNRVGPCVHIYEESILFIESAKNAQTEEKIARIILSSIMIDSMRARLGSLTAISERVTIIDSSLVCEPPCTFGFREGEYRFKAAAPGYRDTLVVCNPGYRFNKRGCPSSSNGGLRIKISLQPLSSQQAMPIGFKKQLQ